MNEARDHALLYWHGIPIVAPGHPSCAEVRGLEILRLQRVITKKNQQLGRLRMENRELRRMLKGGDTDGQEDQAETQADDDAQEG